MRINLKKARIDAGMTQQQVAEKLGISLRYYTMVEAGDRNGSFDMWDALEDLFGTHQRVLRRINATNEVVESNAEFVGNKNQV